MADRGSVPRVLQVVLSLNPGGTERLVLDLAQRLHAEIPMRVCCLDTEGSWARELDEYGIEVSALGRAPGFQPRLGLRIAGLAERHRATLIHAHHYSPFIYSCLAKLRRPGLQVVFTEHGKVSDGPPSIKRRIANMSVFAHLPSRVFAVSRDLRQHLIGEGFAAGRVSVIYNGIDVRDPPDPAERARVRAELSANHDDFVIGTIARLDPVKDLGTLLRGAAALARQRPTMVLIVGDGPERGELERLARDLGLSGRVRFLGQRQDARRWLEGCDAFVNSSISEGVSLTILEAMASGLPVVATAVGGTPEVVTPECGTLVPPRDAEGLRAALSIYAGDVGKRREVGAAGRRRVMEFFALQRMIEQYRTVYHGAP